MNTDCPRPPLALRRVGALTSERATASIFADPAAGGCPASLSAGIGLSAGAGGHHLDNSESGHPCSQLREPELVRRRPDVLPLSVCSPHSATRAMRACLPVSRVLCEHDAARQQVMPDLSDHNYVTHCERCGGTGAYVSAWLHRKRPCRHEHGSRARGTPAVFLALGQKESHLGCLSLRVGFTVGFHHRVDCRQFIHTNTNTDTNTSAVSQMGMGRRRVLDCEYRTQMDSA